MMTLCLSLPLRQGLVGSLNGHELPVGQVLKFLPQMGHLIGVILGHRPSVRRLDLVGGGTGLHPEDLKGIPFPIMVGRFPLPIPLFSLTGRWPPVVPIPPIEIAGRLSRSSGSEKPDEGPDQKQVFHQSRRTYEEFRN